MNCFVTVGTTKFDDLVKAVLEKEFLDVLVELGYRRLNIQVGSSSIDIGDVEFPGLSVNYFTYKSSIEEDIRGADLVVSHAGAGSCLEVMYAKKPCIVVINDKLMDNHQVELAEQLDKLQHLTYTTPRKLAQALATFDKSSLVPYERGDPKIFATYLSEVMGLVD